MNTKEAIKNLEIMSCELSKKANRPENYNAEFAHYLESMSFEMYKMANQLKEIESLYGV